MVSSAYLRLLIFIPAILIPGCASSSPVFLMMYSAYKLNKQGEIHSLDVLLFLFGTSHVPLCVNYNQNSLHFFYYYAKPLRSKLSVLCLQDPQRAACQQATKHAQLVLGHRFLFFLNLAHHPLTHCGNFQYPVRSNDNNNRRITPQTFSLFEKEKSLKDGKLNCEVSKISGYIPQIENLIYGHSLT